MRRTIFLMTALVLTLAGSARAQDTTISATLTPSTPAAGSTLHVAASGSAPELAGVIPESLALDLQRGFALDLRAVAARCAGAAATSGDCPAASRIGAGTALVHASGLIIQDIPATIDVFLGDRIEVGDLAIVVVRVTAAGRSQALRARLLELPSGPFGYELRAEGFAGSVPTLPGVLLELRSLTLDVGADRRVTTTVVKRRRITRRGKRVTVRRKVKRMVRYDLIRNPASCAGSWGARLTVRIAGADHIRDLAVPCTPA